MVLLEVVRAVVVGSGASSSTPKLDCLLGSQPCAVCLDAASATASRNNRLNPSFLIQLMRKFENVEGGTPQEEGQLFNILIDCGKTFRQSVLKTLMPLGVRHLNTVLLTHPHADAVFGLDDLREFSSNAQPLLVYTDAETQADMRRTFPYLFPELRQENGLWVASINWRLYTDGRQNPQTPRNETTLFTSCSQNNEEDTMSSNETSCTNELRDHFVSRIEVGGVKLTSREARGNTASLPIGVFRVWHGHTTCNSYVVPLSGTCDEKEALPVLVYMSDVSLVDDLVVEHVECTVDALERLVRGKGSTVSDNCVCTQARMPPASQLPRQNGAASSDAAALSGSPYLSARVQVLILDMLCPTHFVSHLGFEEAVAAARRLGAAKTYFVGMGHSLEYAATNAALHAAGVGDTMELAWDGCVVFSRRACNPIPAAGNQL